MLNMYDNPVRYRNLFFFLALAVDMLVYMDTEMEDTILIITHILSTITIIMLSLIIIPIIITMQTTTHLRTMADTVVDSVVDSVLGTVVDSVLGMVVDTVDMVGTVDIVIGKQRD